MVLKQSQGIISLITIFEHEDEIYSVHQETMSLGVHVFSKIDTTAESFIVLFFARKVTTVILMKRVMPSSDRKMLRLLSFNITFRHYAIVAKTRSRMTTAIKFSRQNDAGSRAHIVLRKSSSGSTVALALESKALYFLSGKEMKGSPHNLINHVYL